jgi:pimeloyl-ACP methyl ester carboxylesterase
MSTPNRGRTNEETPHAGILGPPAQVVSVRPVVLTARSRGEDVHVRVTAPLVGSDLPVVVFSHGNGWSLDGYAPLCDFWAAHGFVVVQPTHLDSRRLGLADDDPRQPDIWKTRVADLKRAIDGLDLLEASVPGLAGRVDRSRVAVAGHSWGAQTASLLLGARVLDDQGHPGEEMSDPRVEAGVLLAVPGTGGDDLTPFAAEHLPFMNPSFAGLTPPALVVAGDRDQSALSVRGPDWWTDAYSLSPAPKSLLTLFGAEHSLGGIVGYEVAETTDESPERVASIQLLTTTYLRSALGVDASGWERAQAALAASAAPLGRVESK